MTAKVSAALQLRNDARQQEQNARTERRLAERYRARAEDDGPNCRSLHAEARHALERADSHDWTALSLRMGAAALEMLQDLVDAPGGPIRWDPMERLKEGAAALLRGEGVEDIPTIPDLDLDALTPEKRAKVDALLSAVSHRHRGRMVFVAFPPPQDSWVREMFVREDQPPVTPVEGWDSAEFPPPERPQAAPWDPWTVRPLRFGLDGEHRRRAAESIRREATAAAFRRTEAEDPSALMVVELRAEIDGGPLGRGPVTGEVIVQFASGKVETIRSIDTGLVHASLFDDLHRYYRDRMNSGLPALPLRSRVVRDGMGQQQVWLPQDFATAYAPAEEV